MTDSDRSREAALFLQLVLGLQQAAMVGLGKLMNPMTGKLEPNLEGARNTIDTLAAIAERTEGNLEPDEQRVLTQVLTDLRMHFVTESSRSR